MINSTVWYSGVWPWYRLLLQWISCCVLTDLWSSLRFVPFPAGQHWNHDKFHTMIFWSLGLILIYINESVGCSHWPLIFSSSSCGKHWNDQNPTLLCDCLEFGLDPNCLTHMCPRPISGAVESCGESTWTWICTGEMWSETCGYATHAWEIFAAETRHIWSCHPSWEGHVSNAIHSHWRPLLLWRFDVPGHWDPSSGCQWACYC